MYTSLRKLQGLGLDSTPLVQMLKAHFGKEELGEEPINLALVLELTNLNTALWCLRAVDSYGPQCSSFAIWCARQVHHLMPDPRSIVALNVAEAYLQGLASQEELQVAKEAAILAKESAIEANKAAATAAAFAVWTADALWAGVGAKAAANAAVKAGGLELRAAQAAKFREICLATPVEV